MSMPSGRKGDEPQSPSLSTVKRLFAHSGNRCAFPGCTEALAQGDVIVGEICHIKATSPNGPRYDDAQPASERQGYANLILLCANHHKVVDTDPTYTVDSLAAMKATHEGRHQTISSAEVDRVIRSDGPMFITNHFHGPVNAIAQGMLRLAV